MKTILFFLYIVAIQSLFPQFCFAASDPHMIPGSIIDLQPFRETSTIPIRGPGGKDGICTLINLNPNINAWYLVRLRWSSGGPEEFYHLENVAPLSQRVSVDGNDPSGLIIANGQEKMPCDLWGGGSSGLKEAGKSGLPYAPLCLNKLYLRNLTHGHQTRIEAVTEFLRDKVPAGEKIVTVVRDTVFRYIYKRRAERRTEIKREEAPPVIGVEDGPERALLEPEQGNRIVEAADLGIEIEEWGKDGMLLGFWHPIKENPGIFVSVVEPRAIAQRILNSYPNGVGRLDSVEMQGLAYLVAFDLGQFDLKYALGTDHPRVDWSGHILSRMRDRSLPGPDGIGTISPLVSTGLVNPMDAAKTVATFTGGFKRSHEGFMYGPLALRNHGSHYGCLQEGVLFSTLQPGLSTVYVLKGGQVRLKTWTEEDRASLAEIRYARQNGVPIIAGFDETTQIPIPSAFVNRWGEGNWSGSTDRKLRTMRAGLGVQELNGKRFLIYAFFWSATPSAMARVFQAYQCRYAMLVDMNALVHTYLAVYKRQGTSLYVEHLIRGMKEVDSVNGRYVPRFLGYSDDRDFFYLTRKEQP